MKYDYVCTYRLLLARVMPLCEQLFKILKIKAVLLLD